MIETQTQDATKQAMDLLEKLSADVKGIAMVQATRDAGKIVAAEAVTRIRAPGYPGDKPGKVPLAESIEVVVREYDTYTVAFVGASWPTGAHGHLVEFGHVQKLSTGGVMNVPPYPWLRPAAENTRPQQSAAMESRLKKLVEK